MIEHTMQKTVQIQNQATADIDDRATPTTSHVPIFSRAEPLRDSASDVSSYSVIGVSFVKTEPGGVCRN